MSEEDWTNLEKLSITLHEIGAIKFGKYKLKNGDKSNIKLDLRVIVSFPQVLRQVAAVYRTFIERLQLKFDLLAAPPLAGLPIGTALSLEMDCPLIYPREASTSYRSGKSIEGVWRIGQRVVLIDDVITSGQSIVSATAPLKAAGLRISDVVVLIDGKHGGTGILRDEGYHLHAVMPVSYMISVLRDNKRISQKQYSKAMKSLA